MPLSAIVAGTTITGPDLSREEWATLVHRHKNGLAVTMACCGAPGHPRTSGRGLRHFYHAPGSGCPYAEESADHLAMKCLIYRACTAEGWEARVEQPAPDRSFIADVCATRDGRTVAFEVQVSPITPDELAERDARYQRAAIESYWLLSAFSTRPRSFALEYDDSLAGDGGPRAEDVPSIDSSLLKTGPENQLYYARGIRGIGMNAGKRTLFSTNNPGIPVALWVREVLAGNYRKYLEGTAAAIRSRRRLLIRAAPLLARAHAFYPAIRNRSFRKRLDALVRGQGAAGRDPVFRRRVDEIAAEIDWIEREYHSMMAEESGLFSWKPAGTKRTMRPVFWLESEAKVRQLEERVLVLDRWESSFLAALRTLEQEGRASMLPPPDQE